MVHQQQRGAEGLKVNHQRGVLLLLDQHGGVQRVVHHDERGAKGLKIQHAREVSKLLDHDQHGGVQRVVHHHQRGVGRLKLQHDDKEVMRLPDHQRRVQR
jgi:hypothetical protein